MSKQTDPSSDDHVEFGADGRRARLADLQRLEGKLAEALGAIATLREEREAAHSKPISKPLFLANIYTSAVLAGKKVDLIRGIAEAAYNDYCAMLAGAPRKSVEEIYGNGGMTAGQAPVMNIPVTALVAPGITETVA